MYKFVYGFLLVIVLGSSGCSDWLDVQPKTSVPEGDCLQMSLVSRML